MIRYMLTSPVNPKTKESHGGYLILTWENFFYFFWNPHSQFYMSVDLQVKWLNIFDKNIFQATGGVLVVSQMVDSENF